MNPSKVEEEDKVPNIAFANAGTHPRTMMVMHFNTDVAVATVERSWWSQNVASLAYTQ